MQAKQLQIKFRGNRQAWHVVSDRTVTLADYIANNWGASKVAIVCSVGMAIINGRKNKFDIRNV